MFYNSVSAKGKLNELLCCEASELKPKMLQATFHINKLTNPVSKGTDGQKTRSDLGNPDLKQTKCILAPQRHCPFEEDSIFITCKDLSAPPTSPAFNLFLTAPCVLTCRYQPAQGR